MPYVKEVQVGQATLRPLKNPIYDTELLEHNTATTQKLFYTNPIGNPIVAAGANKTEADTNLEQSGAIGKPQHFELYGFQFEVKYDTGGGGDGLNVFGNLHLMYERASFEFRFGQQRPWEEVRLSRIPNGLATDGDVVSADTTDNPTYDFSTNGVPSSHEYFKFDINGQPIPIQYSESFSVRVRWDGTVTITTTATNGYRLVCYMLGVFYSAL